MTWGLDVKMWVGCITYDYVLAFTALGLAGLFRKKGLPGVIGGVSLALGLRFLCHFAAGVIIWDVWMPSEWDNIWIYSLAYNGSYMLPELIFTLIAAIVLFSVPQVKGLLKEE